MNPKRDTVKWEVGIPLVTNPFIWVDLAKGLAVSWVFFVTLAAVILRDEPWAERWPAWGVVTLCHLAVVVLIVAVCLLVFRNRFGARFTLTGRAALYESGRWSRVVSALGRAVGLLARDPGLAGAGLLASTQNSLSLPWGDVRKVTPFPRFRVITLSNSWRPVLRLYCPDDAIYRQACDFVAACTGRGGPSSRGGSDPAPQPMSGGQASHGGDHDPQT